MNFTLADIPMMECLLGGLKSMSKYVSSKYVSVCGNSEANLQVYFSIKKRIAEICNIESDKIANF